MKHRQGRALRKRYGPKTTMDEAYFIQVAETFLHPMIVRHPGDITRKDVHELAGLLERTAKRAWGELPPPVR